MGVSQPTISLSIKKLEEDLGSQLFYSFNRRQLLTDAGRLLLEGAVELLELHQETVDAVQSAEKGTSGQFRFGLSPLFGDCFFGDSIPQFTALYPDIDITMIEYGAYRIDEMIVRGEVDLAVTLKTERTETFDHCHFTRQQNVAVIHKSHPLARSKGLTVSDLKNDTFAIFNEDFILHQIITTACHRAGFRPHFALLSSQWDFMVELVSKNHAVSILPKPVLDKHPAKDVCCIPMVDETRYWDIILAWNKNKYMPHSCKLFLDYLKDRLPPDAC